MSQNGNYPTKDFTPATNTWLDTWNETKMAIIEWIICKLIYFAPNTAAGSRFAKAIEKYFAVEIAIAIGQEPNDDMTHADLIYGDLHSPTLRAILADFQNQIRDYANTDEPLDETDRRRLAYWRSQEQQIIQVLKEAFVVTFDVYDIDRVPTGKNEIKSFRYKFD